MGRRRIPRTDALGRRRLHRQPWQRSGPKPTPITLIQAAAADAESIGQSLTDIRAHVLRELLNANTAMTAYDVLATLDGVGAVAPPTAYRALDFLTGLGYARKIESMNAFVALKYGPTFDPVALSICDSCGHVSEIHTPDAMTALAAVCERAQFAADSVSIELRGVCADGCASTH